MLPGLTLRQKRLFRYSIYAVTSGHGIFAGLVCELVGRTPSGRATIIVLKINLDHRIDLRQGLIDEGVFPPA